MNSLLLLSLFSTWISVSGYGQDGKLRAFVKTSADSSAVQAASVYFDGTTIGTVTNEDGYFSINNSSNTSNPLVISSLGYETLIVDPITLKNSQTLTYYLAESTEQLDEVVLETDPWSRKRKMAEFKREFLGSARSAKGCRILNEDKLKLRYSPKNKQLTAWCAERLVITNDYLRYTVQYDLKFFNLDYDKTGTSSNFPVKTYYAGTSFFKSYDDELPRKIKRRRDAAFLGSLTHFLKALATKSLRERGYRIYHKRNPVPPYQFFELKKTDARVHVVLTAKEINILYKDNEESVLQTKSNFYIDTWGVHSPPDAVLTGGAMGKRRIADQVPINYEPKR